MSEREAKPVKAADGAAPDAAEHKQAPPQSRDPRAAKWQAVVKAATQWNAAHADLVAEFNKLTGGKCSGENAGVSVRQLRQWQMEHGLVPDGKVGKGTLDAARKESKAQKSNDKGEGGQKSDVSFTEAEAGVVEGKKGGAAEAEPTPDLAEAAVGGGETSGEEKRPEEKEDASAEGGSLVQEGADKLGNDMAGEGHGLAVGAAARLALVPHIVNLLRAHKFKERVLGFTRGRGATAC